jgi:ubiquinone biosynthesis O-methyltransferase
MDKTHPHNISSSSYYDEHFNELHNSEAEELRWSVIRNAIISHYPNSVFKRINILDFGCGTGWLSNKLSEFGKVTGVDYSVKSIETAKKQFPAIDFTIMDITSNEINTLGKASFDLIVSSEVIEHVTNHQLFINQISFLLKPGGILVITTPNGRWQNSYFTNEMLAFKQPIENWITGNKLKMLLQTKFNSIHIQTFYANWIYSSRNSTLLKMLANDYIRAALNKVHLFNTYLKLLEQLGCGLYLVVTAKSK